MSYPSCYLKLFLISYIFTNLNHGYDFTDSDLSGVGPFQDLQELIIGGVFMSRCPFNFFWLSPQGIWGNESL